MLKCMECGAEFDVARPMTESHGEVLYHCPNCLGLEIEDVSDILCEACEEHPVEHKGDRWCHDCRFITKQCMHDVIVASIRETRLSIATVVDAIEDILTGGRISGRPNSLIADILAAEIVEIAYTCGCSLDMAKEMAEAWATGCMD